MMGIERIQHGERGSAVLLALIASVLLAAFGHSLILLTSSEQAIAANRHAGIEALYAADAAIARVVPELGRMPDWDDVLRGVTRSTFTEGPRAVTLPSGESIDLDAHTMALRARAQASDPWGPNNPGWRLFAHGPLDRVAPGFGNRAYVAVWVADDPAETDGDPAVDANRILVVRAEAWGPHRSRRMVSVTIGAPGEERAGQERPRLLSWREVR
jgi:hypothetical protein